MDAYIWRTAAGSNKFVCSYTGSDLLGSGTQSNPYRTLTKAYYSGSRSATIVCRGIFTENLTGNHDSNINADYYGAAVWDGQSTYILYGFRHNNMIFINSGAAAGFVGVGSASGAYYVGFASYVLGLAGSPALVDNCQLYWGVVGGNAVSAAVYSRIPVSTSYLVSLGSYSLCQRLTIYDIEKSKMQKSFTTAAAQYGPNYKYSLLSKVAIYLDQYGKFDTCMFAADCTFWVTNTEFTPTGATDADKMASIVAMVATLGNPKLTLTNCKFTSQTASSIFNNPTKQDFTLKPGCAAIENLDVVNGITYYGALPPALNIPIMDDSAGVAGTWDEHTATGLISVSGNAIIFNNAGTGALSEIYSKVIVINPQSRILNGLRGIITPQFAQKFYYGDKIMVNDTHITAGVTLPVGRYLVCAHSIIYGAYEVQAGDILVVTGTGTSFSFNVNDTTAYVISLNDPNFVEPVLVRMQRAIFATVAVGGALQSGGIYYNYNNENITYKGRTIVPGESFMAEDAVNSFSGTAGYLIGIIFNDTRVPVTDWLPLSAWDNYYNLKSGSAQVYIETTGTGSVTTNGTTALVGSATKFTERFKAGDTIIVAGETVRTVDTVTDDTHLTVTVAFSTTGAGKAYTFKRPASSGNPASIAIYGSNSIEYMNQQFLQFKIMLREFDYS